MLQTHLTDSESFSERLDGANERLSRHESAGPIKEIVMALIEDNRDMRDRLDNVRNQLEESRLQVVQLQTNLERAEEAGLRDVVTAIGNRRFFDACFVEEVEKARRLGDNICLALADIDKFKLVNDRFGHLVGDRLLRLFANILAQNVRGQDKVARFGGEEFALMFPGARLGEAVSAVERIRGVLEAKQWTIEPSGERVGKVTASFGVAKLRADESPNDLLRRADERLYEAKIQGRNRVVADDANDENLPTDAARPARRGGLTARRHRATMSDPSSEAFQRALDEARRKERAPDDDGAGASGRPHARRRFWRGPRRWRQGALRPGAGLDGGAADRIRASREPPPRRTPARSGDTPVEIAAELGLGRR